MINGNKDRWIKMGKEACILYVAFLLILPFHPSLLMAQSVPIHASNIEEYLRRQQLLGRLDSSVSFMVRPIDPTAVFDGGREVDDAALFTGKNQIQGNWFFQEGRE